jgi:hypothetical protein
MLIDTDSVIKEMYGESMAAIESAYCLLTGITFTPKKFTQMEKL